MCINKKLWFSSCNELLQQYITFWVYSWDVNFTPFKVPVFRVSSCKFGCFSCWSQGLAFVYLPSWPQIISLNHLVISKVNLLEQVFSLADLQWSKHMSENALIIHASYALVTCFLSLDSIAASCWFLKTFCVTVGKYNYWISSFYWHVGYIILYCSGHIYYFETFLFIYIKLVGPNSILGIAK